MNTFFEPAREIPTRKTDVLIAGAGTAGCIAAIAAARTGADVILIEKMPVPGGTNTNGGIGSNSYYSSNEDISKNKRVVGGIAYELAERITAAGGSTGFVRVEHDHFRCSNRFVPDHEIYKGVVCEMLKEAGVHVLLQTFFCGVQVENGRITAAFIENKNGRRAILAKQYIDASGDGDMARAAGAEQIENWQDYDTVCGGPTGMVFGMAGIDFDRVLNENPGAARALGDDVSATDLTLLSRRFVFAHMLDRERYKPLCDLDINYFTNFQSIHNEEATYINNSKGVKTNAADAENLSDAEMEMRIRIMKMAQAFKACVPGFENSYLSWASTQLGIRASRVTVCDKTITQEEISDAARFEDEIGLYGFHDLAPKHPEYFPKEPGFYGFPYRMLLPKGISNLFMAGRCVTEDIVAHMSTRNVVGCMIMGQGAGTAAALCAQKNCNSRALSYEELRKELLKQDVILDI